MYSKPNAWASMNCVGVYGLVLGGLDRFPFPDDILDELF